MRALQIIGLAVLSGICILIGFYIRNYPYIEWKKEVTIAEGANFFLTLGLGILIPLTISKFADTSRSQKDIIVDEFKEALGAVKQIKDKIDQYFTVGRLSAEDKTVVVYLFDNSDDKLYNLHAYLEELYKSRGLNVHQEIQTAYDDYQHSIMGGSFMANQFISIDQVFQQEQIRKFSAFEQSVKRAQLRIQAL